jgi:hypothetical protein
MAFATFAAGNALQAAQEIAMLLIGHRVSLARLEKVVLRVLAVVLPN